MSVYLLTLYIAREFAHDIPVDPQLEHDLPQHEGHADHRDQKVSHGEVHQEEVLGLPEVRVLGEDEDQQAVPEQ